MNNPYVGTITFLDKKIAIFLNTNKYQNEFFEIRNGKLEYLDKKTYQELHQIFNTPSNCFDLKESTKRKIASILVSGIIATTALGIMPVRAQEASQTISQEELSVEEMSTYLQGKGIFDKTALEQKDMESYISRAEAAQMLFNVSKKVPLKSEQSISFLDIDHHLCKDAILDMSSKGIIVGTPEGTYLPDDSIIIDHFILMLYRFISQTPIVIDQNEVIDFVENPQNSKWNDWAIKNGFCHSENDNIVYMSKEQCIQLLYQFSTKYDLFQDHIGFNEDAISFLDALKSNQSLPEDMKTTFQVYAKLIESCHLSDETKERINNTFKTLHYESKENNINNFSGGVTAQYFPSANTIAKYRNDKESMVHEGIHALTSNMDAAKIVGFADVEDSMYGRGLTEGLTEVLTEELLHMEGKSYFYSKNMARLLTEAVGNDKMLEYFISADLPGLLEELTDIYSQAMPRKQALLSAQSLISKFDTLYFFDTNKLEVDMAFVDETIAEMHKLSLLKKGTTLENDPVMQEYIDKIHFHEQYVYYHIDKSFFDPSYKDAEVVQIQTLSENSCYTYPDVTQLYSISPNSIINYVAEKHPELFENQKIYRDVIQEKAK